MQKTCTVANGKWPSILSHFGIESKFLTKKHCPCPICGGEDRYRFIDKDGDGTYFCNQCGAGDGISLLMKFKGWDFITTAKRVDEVSGRVQCVEIIKERSIAEKEEANKKILRGCRKVVKGDPVSLYLLNRCGIGYVPDNIWYHPALTYKDRGKFPAMIAVIRDNAEKGLALHRTYLTEDGRKASVPSPKKITEGRPLERGAIHLSKYANVLGIAEGIETAISAMLHFNIPVWAACSSEMLKKWEPPEGVGIVIIFGDNDENFTGHAASYFLANKLKMKNKALNVTVKIPETLGDWNDFSQ